MEAYAVVQTGGKQYRVQAGDVLEVERLDGDVGAKVTLSSVMAMSNGSELVVGAPEIDGAAVVAEILEQFRGKKVVAFKMKKRKGYHRKVGHRQELTKLKVEAING
ncbi:MAG: 50S ribosomal protein L21 [Kiritimatiellae bacterium]|nr:50S ribosomal protein L21 [Kiritimatiellia bacterium]